MTHDLVERLRKTGHMDYTLIDEAADKLESYLAENATLRAEKDEIRKAVIEEAAKIAVDHAEGSISLSRLADADGDAESSRVHVNDAFAFRTLAAAIRNMGERT